MKLPWSRKAAAPPQAASDPAPVAEKKGARTLALGTSHELGSFLVFGSVASPATPSGALSLYERTTAVSVPIDMVADPFSVLTPVLVEESDDGEEKLVKSHPILDLLRRPSPQFSQELFLETLAKNYLITGECPVAAVGNIGRPPLEIQPLSPSNLSTMHGQDDSPSTWIVSGNTLDGSYQAQRKGLDVRFYSGLLRELIVIRSYSTRDNAMLRGQSPLVSAAGEARHHILGVDHNVSLLENGGRVSLVFHFKEDLGDDDFEAIKERVLDNFMGPRRAGRVAVTSGGNLEVKEMGVSPKDLDWKNLSQVATQAVAMRYHVPLPLITPDRQTLDNYREGKLALYDDAIIPLSKRIFGGLEMMLFPRFGLDQRRFSLGFDPDKVSALASRRNDELVKRRQIGIETPDELRALIGRGKVEGGGILYQPASMVPVGTDLFASNDAPAPSARGLSPDREDEDPEDEEDSETADE